MEKFFDYYGWKAWVQPALVAAAPAALAAFLWLPGGTSAFTAGGLVLVWGALGVLVSHFVRDVGARKQAALFAAWGGAPSTQLLRCRESTNQELLSRRHQKLQAVTGVQLPSEADETRDPQAADRQYEECVSVLREKTRDHRLLLQENCSYGFRRNLLALRSVALGITVGSLIAVVFYLLRYPRSLSGWICFSVIALLILAWTLAIREGWVRRSAERYARQLLAAGESLA